MKAIIQRVKSAAVTADGEPAGRCNEGLMVLLGVVTGDTDEDSRVLAEKISKMRIFTDENGKMNLSVKDVSGGILAVSNFTLAADISHGNRPSFIGAMEPSEANRLYCLFCEHLESLGVEVGRGVFGADMSIDLVCDGPVTIIADSEIFIKR